MAKKKEGRVIRKGLDLAGEETYKGITAFNRIASHINLAMESLAKASQDEMETADQSLNRVLDILTLLKNEVYLASTDSAYLIELLELVAVDHLMLRTVLRELKTANLVTIQKAITAETIRRRSKSIDE